MKITLEFKGQEDAQHHINGYDYYLCLVYFHEFLRSQLKHGDLDEIQYEAHEEIQRKFFEILEENNVNLN